ncbi:MAG TPA: DUF4199 domain-containing protein [Pyrinomonadaceae bacterium]|nr:DUF4199 domain-containing protein [Pyrinomonadaceae bacterium]
MKKTVLTFGLISGAISSFMMVALLPFADQIGFDNKGLILGYTTIVLSFLLVVFGIRSYRDNIGQEKISFGRAFTVGILITLISCACYVVAWEIIYFKFRPDFGEKFAAHAIEQVRASSASQQVVDAKIQEMKEFKAMYDNPLFNAAITFMEPFPIGLLITLISAFIFSRKRDGAAVTNETKQRATA